MDCHYHPGREGTSTCNVCGKPMCAECAMEIAGKTYCKDCLEKIVGVNSAASEPKSEPSISETIQGMDSDYTQDNYNYFEKSEPKTPSFSSGIPSRESIIEDVLSNDITSNNPYDSNPYSFDDPLQTSPDYGEPSYPQDNSYLQDPYSEPSTPQYDYNQPSSNSPYAINNSPTQSNQPSNNYFSQPVDQYNQYQEPVQQNGYDDDFIYPDHTYEPPEINRISENKYDQYLDDLYMNEPDIPLSEQLAKDEEVYGSLTKNPYEPQETLGSEDIYYEQHETYEPYPPQNNLQSEGFLNINDFSHNNPQADYTQRPQYPPTQSYMHQPQMPSNMDTGLNPSTKSIHNLPMIEKPEKEPYGAVDIILTIILIILIILVVYYVVYLFLLSSHYPTFTDALYGLADPQTLFGYLTGK